MGHSPVNIEVFSCAKQKKFKVHTPFLEPIAASHGLRQGMLFAQGSCRFNLWHINTFNLLMKTTESSWKILWADFYFRFFDKPFLLLLLNISKVLPCYSTSTYQLFFNFHPPSLRVCWEIKCLILMKALYRSGSQWHPVCKVYLSTNNLSLKVMLMTHLWRHIFLLNNTSTDLVERCRISFPLNILMFVN